MVVSATAWIRDRSAAVTASVTSVEPATKFAFQPMPRMNSATIMAMWLLGSASAAVTQPATSTTQPPTTTGSRPTLSTSHPEIGDGAYMPSTCAEITVPMPSAE